MGRPVVLSNGQMFVGLNKDGLVHDFYYPYVGLDNLTTTRSERHKIGVWVDGQFSWVNDEGWNKTINFEENALVGRLTMRNEALGIELHFLDFVDSEFNAFCRQIKVVNRNDGARNVRLFMHQVFEISHSGRADTALYVPDENYLLDYKGRTSLLIYAESSDHKPFDQYAVGNCGIEGKEGTYKDAEDGELSNNPVEHGGVDSVIRINLDLGLNQAKIVDYWVVAASSQKDAEKKHHELKKYGLGARIRETRRWWNEWLSIADTKLRKIDEHYRTLTKKSLLVIKAHTDRRGSILASGDSSIFNYGRDYYCYFWPRDGAYAVWPLLRLGFKDEARNFFEFCRDIIHEDGYMMHKYQPDRAIGSTWHPLVHGNQKELAIQEDETASVILMLGEYLKITREREFVEQLYGTLVRPAGNFMASYIDDQTNLPHASYDLWEEKFLTTTYTTAVTYAALKVAANLATEFDYPDDALRWREAALRIESSIGMLFDEERQAFRKGYLLQQDGTVTYDNTLDVSSMYGMMMFGPNSAHEMVSKTLRAIEETMLDKTTAKGVARYENDNYMRVGDQAPSNPWFICTLWLAQYYSDTKNQEKARDILFWLKRNTTESGILSEQINPESSTQIGVSPLVWSHAEFINTVLDISEL